MKYFLVRLMTRMRRMVWAIIVAYMLGLHNFYHGEDKTQDDIAFKAEVIDVQEDSAPGA